jgi:hypothetical protein
MPIIGTFSGPPPPYGGSASANQYSLIEELLHKLPDNTANLIQAKDVRDSVYTLWKNIEEVASHSATSSIIYYDNLTPTPTDIGGISKGTTFTEQTMQEMWDALLYPYVEQVVSIIPDIYRELGDSNSATLTWSVTKGSENIVSITFSDLSSVAPTNVPIQTDTKNFTATQNIGSTFSITAVDNLANSETDYCYFYWINRRYWGTIPSSNTLASVSSSPFSYTDLALPTISSELDNGYTQSRVIETNNDYVVFVWPNDSVDLSSTLMNVRIGGFGNNNWIKTRNNVQFTNQYGYTGTNYDVWVFGNTQSLNTFIYDIS